MSNLTVISHGTGYALWYISRLKKVPDLVIHGFYLPHFTLFFAHNAMKEWGKKNHTFSWEKSAILAVRLERLDRGRR